MEKEIKKTITALFAFAALIAMLALAGCIGQPSDNNEGSDATADPENTSASTAAPSEPETTDAAITQSPAADYGDAAWFCPAEVAPVFDSPAIAINIATGEVLVACPDPLCTHSEGSETCFFNLYQDETHVYAAEYLSGHIYFAAEKKTEDGRRMKLYDYDIASNRIGEIYTYEYSEGMVCLYKNSNTLFFTAITHVEGDGEDSKQTIGLFACDPDSKKVTTIDDDAQYALDRSEIAFYDDCYIYSAGYNQDEDRMIYCKRSYDGSSEELIEALPDGTPFEIFGWGLKSSGVFANTWGQGGVYFVDGDIKLDFPTDSATTYPVRYEDSICFQTRSSEIIELGKDPETGAMQRGYAYDNELYVLKKDGSYKHYTIDCEYHFVIAAIYENTVVGRIAYKIPKPGQCLKGGDSDIYTLPNFIRIDLETGETNVYDTSRRNRFEVESFVSGITLNEN